MKQWFYIKNDLSKREDVRGIIQRPIITLRHQEAFDRKWKRSTSMFDGLQHICTRDLVQEHIAYKVWPLVNDWEMPKEIAAGSSKGGLVYLRYTYHYRSQFDEPNGD